MFLGKEILEILDSNKKINLIKQNKYIPVQKKKFLISQEEKSKNANGIVVLSDLGLVSSIAPYFLEPASASITVVTMGIVAKTTAIIAKNKALSKAKETRRPYEEEVAKSLSKYINFNGSNNDIAKENLLETMSVLDWAIGYNFSLNQLHKSPNIYSYTKKAKMFFLKAHEIVGNSINKILNKSEKKWVNKFIKKPFEKIIGKKAKKHFDYFEERKYLLNVIEKTHENLELIKVYKPEREKGVYKEREELLKDINLAIDNTYSNALGTVIKYGTCCLLSDIYISQNEYGGMSNMPENLKNKYMKEFNEISSLGRIAKEEKYEPISVVSKSVSLSIMLNQDLSFDTIDTPPMAENKKEIFFEMLSSLDYIHVNNNKPILPEIEDYISHFKKSFKTILRNRGYQINIDKINQKELLFSEKNLGENAKKENSTIKSFFNNKNLNEIKSSKNIVLDEEENILKYRKSRKRKAN